MFTIKYAPEDSSGGAPPEAILPGGEEPTEEPLAPASWDDFLASAPEPIRNLYTAQTSGLRSALDSERDQRKALAKQLKEATSKMEEGSDARQQMEQISAQLEAQTQRADFYEEVARPEIGCVNAKLAYIAAQSDGLIDGHGRVDWDAMRDSYPELFRQNQKAPAGNAGSGTQSPPPQSVSIDDMIRRKAGIR